MPLASKAYVSGTAVDSCGSITSPGDYYLSRNLTCPGTGLLLNGAGIRLNLNGHYILYGTSGGTMGAVFGIESDACWDTSHKAKAAPCNSSPHGLAAEIYNGYVIQSPQAPSFSHAIFIGQNGNTSGQTVNVHDVGIQIQQPGSMGVYSNWVSGPIVLEHNSIYDNVKSINYPGQGDLSARSQFQGEAIFLDNTKSKPVPDRIDNNKIIGSPQGGIRDTSTGAQIYQNDISQTSTYANDFCIDSPGQSQQIHDNYCHPVNGRGIHVNGTGSNIYNNSIVVTEAATNHEYGGCEIGGAYGIQLEQDIQGAGSVSVTGNTVTLNTGACGGGAIRITGWPSGARAAIQGNNLTVNVTGGANKYYGMLYYLDDSDLASVTFGGDTLKTSGLVCAGIAWDGASNFKASLAGCNASYAIVAGNGPGNPATFQLTGAPNTKLGCGAQSAASGTINGTRVACRN